MAIPPGVMPGNEKVWKAAGRVNGLVTEHVSPHRQRVVAHLFKDMDKRAKFFMRKNWVALPAIATGVAVVWWADRAHKADTRTHWS